MTEEEIKALQDRLAAEEAARKSAEEASLQWKVAAEKNKTDLEKVVDELKTERQKKQEALEKANLSNDGTDVNAMIEAALQTREQQSRKVSFEEALTEFKAAKPEFQADAAGLVFSKFENGLRRFNFSDVATKEQMKSRLEEAYRFLNYKPENGESYSYEGGIQNPQTVTQNQTEPSKEIKSVLETAGIDESRFKTLKEKYPEALESLGLS